MRYLILFGAVLVCLSPAAFATGDNKGALTTAALEALARYCIPPIAERKDVAGFVIAQGLVELPKEQAASFAPNGGRVFEIPSAKGNAVLILNTQFGDNCAIAVHELDPARFWQALDTSAAGFSLMREKRIEEDKVTKREYEKETLAGPITLLVTASDVARTGGLQGLMTLARVQK
jgi:FAD/FMN-containing dehydrogenase